MDTNALAFACPTTKETNWPEPQDSGANAQNQLVVAASDDSQTGGKVKKAHVVTGFSVSVSAALVAAATLTITDGIVREKIVLPAGWTGPLTVNYPRPLYFRPGLAVTATLTAGGAGIVTTLALRGFSRVDH